MANGYVCFLRVDVGSGSPFTADKGLLYSPVQCFVLYNHKIFSLNLVFEL